FTATPNCRVVSRGCRFPATDGVNLEPKLANFEPTGNSLVANGSAHLAESGMAGDGAPAPGLRVNHWTFEPTNRTRSWSGWQVSQGQYTIVGDLSSPPSGRCVSSSLHTVITGLMTG